MQSEVVVQRCSVNVIFHKTFANSQENNCAEVCFSEVPSLQSAILFRKKFYEHFFVENLLVAASKRDVIFKGLLCLSHRTSKNKRYLSMISAVNLTFLSK